MSRRNPAVALSVVGVAAAVGAVARPATNAAATRSTSTTTIAATRRPRAGASAIGSVAAAVAASVTGCLRDLAGSVQSAGARRARLGGGCTPPVLLDEGLQPRVVG